MILLEKLLELLVLSAAGRTSRRCGVAREVLDVG